jgi:hypothetical protein
MKKIMFLVALVIGFAMTSHAQSAVTMPLVAGDTANNAGTVSKVISATAGYSAIGMKVKITKISGTLAGTAKFQGSVDNSDWDDIGSAFTVTDVASQFKYFTATGGAPYTYYRILVTGSGTMSEQVRVIYTLKKFNQ